MKEGCQIVSESVDILSLLGLKMHPEIQIQNTKQFGSKEEEKIYNILTINPQNIEILTQITGLNMMTVSVSLTMLELSSLAMNTGENNWIKRG
jgi:predicted Rossmann fold nucleotide-binding protein DprA/Smf involved in DNA uptake